MADHVTCVVEEDRPDVWYVWMYNHTRRIRTLEYVVRDKEEAIRLRDDLQRKAKDGDSSDDDPKAYLRVSR